jgi:hypothetical protein
MLGDRIFRRSLLFGLATALAFPVLGCGSGSDSETPAPVQQAANKKSLEASGDYYKQLHQEKKK